MYTCTGSICERSADQSYAFYHQRISVIVPIALLRYSQILIEYRRYAPNKPRSTYVRRKWESAHSNCRICAGPERLASTVPEHISERSLVVPQRYLQFIDARSLNKWNSYGMLIEQIGRKSVVPCRCAIWGLTNVPPVVTDHTRHVRREI